jgi:hypothetical protein
MGTVGTILLVHGVTGGTAEDVTDRRPDPSRIALQRKHAAEVLDISPEHFDRFVRPRVRCVYVGSLRLWSLAELERFLAEHAAELEPAMMDTTQKAPAHRQSGRGHGTGREVPNAQAS